MRDKDSRRLTKTYSQTKGAYSKTDKGKAYRPQTRARQRGCQDIQRDANTDKDRPNAKDKDRQGIGVTIRQRQAKGKLTVTDKEGLLQTKAAVPASAAASAIVAAAAAAVAGSDHDSRVCYITGKHGTLGEDTNEILGNLVRCYSRHCVHIFIYELLPSLYVLMS